MLERETNTGEQVFEAFGVSVALCDWNLQVSFAGAADILYVSMTMDLFFPIY